MAKPTASEAALPPAIVNAARRARTRRLVDRLIALDDSSKMTVAVW
ncbi:MAG: hypothetical protein F2692_14620 [Actinobacteria bacterium]|nr:hypothetical protein [Actinomycetota bacterium]